MSSHDPLVFSSLKRTEVLVFSRNEHGAVSAEQPELDPRGMGIQAILASELFRLRSGGLDLDTQEDLDERRRLAMKEGPLSAEEQRRLKELTERLHRLGFWKSAQDPLYELFLRKWTERERAEWRATVELTPDQLRDRDRLADEIAAEIDAERKSG